MKINKDKKRKVTPVPKKQTISVRLGKVKEETSVNKKKIVKIVVLKEAIKSIGKISDVFKEGQRQKKWSAKRSVSGVLVTAAVADMSVSGLTEYNVVLSFIAILPLCFTVFSKA